MMLILVSPTATGPWPPYNLQRTDNGSASVYIMQDLICIFYFFSINPEQALQSISQRTGGAHLLDRLCQLSYKPRPIGTIHRSVVYGQR